MKNIHLSHLPRTLASVFTGPGLEEGLDQANDIEGIATGSPRDVVINVLNTILDYAALLAVAMVILAGFYLLLSFGEEEKKEKAKKIVFYTLIGLAVL